MIDRDFNGYGHFHLDKFGHLNTALHLDSIVDWLIHVDGWHLSPTVDELWLATATWAAIAAAAARRLFVTDIMHVSCVQMGSRWEWYMPFDVSSALPLKLHALDKK